MGKMDAWDDFEVAYKHSDRIYVWGPPGTGKTTAARNALAQNNKDVWTITLNEDWAVQELQGQWIPGNLNWQMNYGPVVEAFKRGDGLVVNELQRASGPVQDLFIGVLDAPDVAVLTLPNSEKIYHQDGFRAIATSNSPPTDMEDALIDRFDVILNITTPHPEIIGTLNNKLSKLGDFILASYLDDSKRIISPRRAFSLANFLAGDVKPEQAVRLAFGERDEDTFELLNKEGVL